MTTTLEAPTRNQVVTDFPVDVVDGSGLPVSYQPVIAEYRYRNGHVLQRVTSTDAGGRVRFTDRHPEMPRDVTLISGRERSGPHPLGRDLLIIEM